MGAKLYSKVLVTLLIISLSGGVMCQNWQWGWAKSTNDSIAGPVIDILHVDGINNLYFRGGYSDSIVFPDTSFFHDVNMYTNNYAIAQYNTSGEFLKAIDLYTWSGNNISYPEVVTDSEMNVYISGSFQERIFFQDTLLVHCNTPYTLQPDIFLIKLNPDNQVVWADLIGGTFQDNLEGIVISNDNNIYIASEHYASSAYPTTVSFFTQDTAYYDNDFVSILKSDTDKNLIWRNEFQGQVTGDFFMGADSNVHFQGHTFYNIVIEGDTIFNPYNPNNYQPEFIISYDTGGNLLQAKLIDYKIRIYDIQITNNGNYYLSAAIIDTLVLNNDTIIVQPNHYNNIIMKLDNDFEVLWYKNFIQEPDQLINSFRLNLINENLVFNSICTNNIQFEDTLMSLGDDMEVIIGEYIPNGELIDIIATNSTGDLLSGYSIVDNCDDIIITGYFKGSAIFNQDTLSANIAGSYDSFISKLSAKEPYSIDLGSDTSVCGDYLIIGPLGYSIYSWNDSLSYENSYIASQSGPYFFGCSNDDGCWLYDTIIINILPDFEIELGSDTMIALNDTITFSVTDTFDSYLWSDGSTSSLMPIIGSDYGLGKHTIWVEVFDGQCYAIDSVNIYVIDNSSIEELSNSTIYIYPNPAEKTLNVINNCNLTIESVTIYNLSGLKLISTKLVNQYIDIEKLHTGIYIVEIVTNKSTFRIKLLIK